MTKKVHLKCSGGDQKKSITKAADTIEFVTNGSCKFTSFNFTGDSPGFSNKTPASGAGASVSYSYDGTAIPHGGYPFEYTTDTPELGNGSGTIKND